VVIVVELPEGLAKFKERVSPQMAVTRMSSLPRSCSIRASNAWTAPGLAWSTTAETPIPPRAVTRSAVSSIVSSRPLKSKVEIARLPWRASY